MILNHEHRFLFIHVPKAAGTTITRALSPLTTFRDIEIGGTKYGEALQDLFASRFDLRKHSTAEAIRAKCPGHVWRRFFVFAFVRDPYARAYSVYRFLQRWKDGPHAGMVGEMSFAEFVASDAIANGEIEIAKPQAYWLCKGSGLHPGIDFVGRVENFAEDFGFVQSVIHRKPAPWTGARHDNKSAAEGEWKSALTPDAKTWIEALYACDFEMFDYARLPTVRDAA
ncbi:MAG: sulfotransferase family 2 domain-containing protein [Pseudomonadota bacterium]